jgi:23S rRNA (guanosine2251-2'-O)-methyltransferase
MKRSETIYGMHAVRVMLERHAERVLTVRLAEQRDDPRARAIEELARRHERPLQRVDMHALRRQLGDVAHQGVAAEITPLPPWSEDELLNALQSAPTPLLLALDGVQDPHNLGACLRTADACGALALIVPRDRAAQLTPAVRKVAAGAAETTPVVVVTNLVRTLKLLKETGLWVVGADAAAEQAARQVDLRGPVVLVLGAEGTGLRQLTRQNCDFLVHLPQRGTVESFNVSVAAAMLLYETLRQREAA